jgi:hypothetical protein
MNIDSVPKYNIPDMSKIGNMNGVSPIESSKAIANHLMYQHIDDEKALKLLTPAINTCEDLQTGKFTNADLAKCYNKVQDALGKCSNLKSIIKNSDELCQNLASQNNLKMIKSNEELVEKLVEKILPCLQDYCKNTKQIKDISHMIKDELKSSKPLAFSSNSYNLFDQDQQAVQSLVGSNMEGVLDTLYPVGDIEESLAMFSNQSSSAPCHMNWFMKQMQEGRVCEVITLVLNSIVKDREAFCEKIGHILEDAKPVLKTGVNLFSFVAHRVLPCVAEMCRQKHGIHIKHIIKVENMLKNIQPTSEKTPSAKKVKENFTPIETFKPSNSSDFSIRKLLFWVVLAIVIYCVVKMFCGHSTQIISIPTGSKLSLSATQESVDFLKTL